MEQDSPSDTVPVRQLIQENGGALKRLKSVEFILKHTVYYINLFSSLHLLFKVYGIKVSVN